MGAWCVISAFFSFQVYVEEGGGGEEERGMLIVCSGVGRTVGSVGRRGGVFCRVSLFMYAECRLLQAHTHTIIIKNNNDNLRSLLVCEKW